MSPSETSLESLLQNARSYAGIGARNTPPLVLPLMEQLGEALGHYPLTLRSGGSPGADSAFERGCDRAGGAKEIFLPWKGFNGNPSPLFSPPREAEAVAALLHPNWRACSPGARKLHARNCQQVYGRGIDAPADFVLFWAPECSGVIEGGTATAVRLAREMNIPTFNLWDDPTRLRWQAFVDGEREKRLTLWETLLGSLYKKR